MDYYWHLKNRSVDAWEMLPPLHLFTRSCTLPPPAQGPVAEMGRSVWPEGPPGMLPDGGLG